MAMLTLAPIAGYTDIAFRKICIEEGASLTTTEMVSVKALLYDSKKTHELMEISELESPSSVQLFGSSPDDFARVIKLDCLKKFDWLDINMGCPMPKITKNGDGVALLKQPQIASELVRVLKQSGKKVSCKVRLGIDTTEAAVEFCKALERAGADLIAVHGRTAKQMYSGKANWDKIGEVASELKVPVLGNGDILTRLDAIEKIAKYNLAGVMIGRGALTNPTIFNLAPASLEKIKATILRHISYLKNDNRLAVHKFRKHLVYYLKHFNLQKQVKQKLLLATSLDEIRRIVYEFR